MRFRSSKQEYLAAFSYASLTDVVLQLLIFFLLSSAFVIQSGVKVQLPKALLREQETRSQIIVSVDGEGNVYLNSRPLTMDQLLTQVRDLLRKEPDQVVIIQADRNVTLQKAVEAMDAVKSAGGTRFLIATEPLE
ncbi:MAG: hypothetical protein A2X67_00535 [Ignavibacteria bacterium GWA2_55_11]|nr:MAG: hypothetical protein A2X67_00535 [Ignavibacteria bacterium GWA2_55_11]OGU45591.1 MAG: hypothetical protein A2X68_11250 [Ignavibacteria bacterium GWC2_56_12]OGU63385.1 MAG: hypothetical protein A3C56_01340 [Ignavibacteria bacterium RIFCSPHIGHO2_02_FULL_56_12]OGU70475.1 MAG: hypothetical protein A3G43_03250 [Ignavibacteria bacterium RIFCSPLOWO2_12_FULL_56_21]OGU73926.1 MAG: hypothetical protein A3H45_14810 [Ignavibacteria bacterium RIFCSPLOWO2_02_FULL_55_14]HAV22456.1 biopolymer transpor